MQKLSGLMQKEMTRQEFLTILGFGVATIMGLSGLLQLLGKKNPFQQQVTARSYGGGVYGGHKEG